MDLRTLRLLAEYNRKTNGEMNGLIQKLDASQWRQEFKGYFKSIHSLCNHIYLGDFNWLKRFSKLRPFSYNKKEVFNQELPFSSVVFETAEDYLAKREELDRLLLEFISEIKVEDLDHYLEYVDSHGKLYSSIKKA